MKRPAPLITLTTDFGMSDGTVGAMIGVIKSISPSAEIINIAHDIPQQDIVHGAWALFQAAPFFPAEAIHVAVVDPGVGTRRRAVLIQAEHGTFLGPDSGLLTWAANQAGPRRFFAFENTSYRLGPRGLTFDGRDLFAPVAAHLANGVDASLLGEEIRSVVDLTWPEPSAERSRVEGEVLLEDRFGNLVTNIPMTLLAQVFGDGGMLVVLEGRPVGGLSAGYAAIEGKLGCVINGSGLLEIASPGGSAASLTYKRRGDRVVVTGRV